MSALLALDLQQADLADLARFCRQANVLGIPSSAVPFIQDDMLVLPIPAGRVRVTPIRRPAVSRVAKAPTMRRARRRITP